MCMKYKQNSSPNRRQLGCVSVRSWYLNARVLMCVCVCALVLSTTWWTHCVCRSVACCCWANEWILALFNNAAMKKTSSSISQWWWFLSWSIRLLRDSELHTRLPMAFGAGWYVMQKMFSYCATRGTNDEFFSSYTLWIVCTRSVCLGFTGSTGSTVLCWNFHSFIFPSVFDPQCFFTYFC